MQNGSLRSVLDKKGKNIPVKLRIQIAKDIAKGMLVTTMHSKHKIPNPFGYLFKGHTCIVKK